MQPNNSATNTSPWFLSRPGLQHRLRLYCFCYAGGNALSYMPWQSSIHPAVEICAIQLPGRGARVAETPITSMPDLIESISHAIGRQPELPFAFFGHSLGALLAFELARHRKRLDLPMPLHLFVSGCNAPQLRDPPRGLHKFSNDALIEALKEYNGTPPEILAHRELMELVLPTVRADFSLAENYRYVEGLLLDTPMTVLAGTRDDRSSLEQAEGWAKETVANCDIRWFDGDHFFINPEKDAVIECINDALRPSLARLAAAWN